MTTTNRRAPADHKSTADEKRFTFEQDGESFTFPEPISKVTSPGFIRRNRTRDPLDLGFTVFETLAGESPDGVACLEAIDNMTPEQFSAMVDEFWEFAEVPSGE